MTGNGMTTGYKSNPRQKEETAKGAAAPQWPEVAPFRQGSWPRLNAQNTAGRSHNLKKADRKPEPIPLPNIPLPTPPHARQ
jgi:hypothetical protein